MKTKKILFLYAILAFSALEGAVCAEGIHAIETENRGDADMINCLSKAVKKEQREEVSDKDNLHGKPLKERDIFIGAGHSGLLAFQSPRKGNEVRILMTWQYLKDMEKLPKDVLYIMPKHGIDARLGEIEAEKRLIKIQGVLHNRTFESLEPEDIKNISPETKFIVMLAGDTQQQDATWMPYTSEMVKDLLAQLDPSQETLFLNGPRTGKFEEKRGKNGELLLDEKAHRKALDHVTQFVMDQFNKNKPKDKDKASWQLLNFEHSNSESSRYWPQALKFCIENPHTVLVLPGESTSMISEALSLGIRPVIYCHPAMTEVSKKFVDLLVQEGRAYLEISSGNKEYRQDPLKPQEEVVVKELKEILGK